jgi:hypothetical protein
VSSTVEYVRKSFTIPADLWVGVEQIVQGGNQSAYVAEALRRQVERDNLRSLVDELEAASGPATAEELAALARELK